MIGTNVRLLCMCMCVFVCACVRVYLTESMLTNSIFTVPGSSARPEAAQGEDPDLV